MSAATRRAPLVALSTCFLAATLAASSPAAASARGRGVSPIDGRWTFTLTRSELAKHRQPVVLAGSWSCALAKGRIGAENLSTGHRARGTYRIDGNVAYFVFLPGAIAVVPGKTYAMRFNVYRDRLTWSSVPGRIGLRALAIEPWIRTA